MKSKKIIDVIAIALALLFIYAAVEKLVNIGTFRTQLDKSPLVGSFSSAAVWLLPLLQVLTSVLLIRQVTRLAGLFCAFFLIAAITVYLVTMISAGDSQPCDCGELWQGLSEEWHIILISLEFCLQGSPLFFREDWESSLSLQTCNTSHSISAHSSSGTDWYFFRSIRILYRPFLQSLAYGPLLGFDYNKYDGRRQLISMQRNLFSYRGKASRELALRATSVDFG